MPKRLEKDLERAQQEMERRSQVRLQMRNESVRAALAFAMAKHPRLGANSSARTLPPFFFESVFDALHVDSVFSVEQVEERVFIGRISGLDGSPYRRGVFHFAIFVPADYPFKPPRVKLLTRIFSAGVDDSGENPWNLHQRLDWSPAYSLETILMHYEMELGNEVGLDGRFMANVDPCVLKDPERAQLWKENLVEYKRLAREWTELYATTEQVDARPLRENAAAPAANAAAAAPRRRQLHARW